jgi:hypothetical protein
VTTAGSAELRGETLAARGPGSPFRSVERTPNAQLKATTRALLKPFAELDGRKFNESCHQLVILHDIAQAIKISQIELRLPETEALYRSNKNAGWSSLVARQAHNLKAVGSNPTPATKPICGLGLYLDHSTDR